MAWNRIRREVQYRAQLAATTWRIEKLNEILPGLQAQFEQALSEGTLLELGPGEVSWVDELLTVEDA